MKKLIATVVLGLSLLITSPAFAYEVKSGDTMSGIAKENGLSLHQLSELNPQVKDLNKIYVAHTVNTVRSEAVSKPVETVNTVETASTVETATPISNVSAYEKDLLARLVRAEAQGESYAGKVAVAIVVLNRVDHVEFPNSVSAVINQKGQFSPVGSGSINTPADAESTKAVGEALTSNRAYLADSIFFYNAKTANSRWLDSRATTTVIGNHTFKK